ncbi:winged helix-turn-helix transcriptional regulator [Candidatus Woesearchaeota archaeon]|nr:winged helix-turn-helix transcriptional regulator [Candidatus Woesearchaeota archaeon]MBI2582528.1 winged helix-turn-helix transcriptional regulator [Candidatus Woesearchaeota archaeon]
MANINLPKEILEKEAFKTLPAKEKEEYVSNLLKKILDLNEDGITISQIREATGMTYSTIWHHLEILSCTAQAHKISRGNLDVYYHNGTMNHLNEYDGGKAKYSISSVKNREGNFVCIHEKRQNRLGNHTITTGISIPVELIDNLVAELNKVKNSNIK